MYCYDKSHTIQLYSRVFAIIIVSISLFSPKLAIHVVQYLYNLSYLFVAQWYFQIVSQVLCTCIGGMAIRA